MITLDSQITELPKVGAVAAKSLSKLGITTARDLLFYFPYRYLDFSKFSPISEIKENEVVTIRGHIKTIQSRYSFRGRMSLCEAIISDNSGSIKIIWFNQPYLAKTLQPGDEVLLSGVVSRYKTLQMQNPIYEKASDDNIHTGRLVPVYHATENLYNRTIRTLVNQLLPLADDVVDIIPQAIIQTQKLPALSDTIRTLHFPDDYNLLKQAQRRIIFDEVLVQQLAVQTHKRELQKTIAPAIPADAEYIKQFLDTLPFTLTNGQKRAIWDIAQDMEKGQPMNRLLEGDVGSGKTLVALVAAMLTAKAGKQAVILAPTEILAQQHYDSFRNYLHNSPYAVALLTRTFRTVNDQPQSKAEMQISIANDSINIIIGTHALLQGVTFSNLGLVIVDEQHRFGVHQRSQLVKLSEQSETRPHLLSMTATPIPRTLALSIYGDLDISILPERPAGRLPIATEVVTEANRQQSYDFITKQIASGRQAFVVTPRVEEDDTTTLKSAKQEVFRLQTAVFPNLRIGLMHGKMKGVDKEDIMTSFHNKELDILVATSVIEIGIDVPNASIIVIEDAERFGLAQLHQLRGRVGRDKHESYCMLFTQSEDPAALERLNIFAQTADGFKLAELDLQQRGFGSLFGTQQTGYDFKFVRYLTLDVLKIGQESAAELLQTDPDLTKNRALKNQVDPLLEQIHLE